jgi:putative proteasome-type protease
MRKLWESALKQAFDQMPPIEWDYSDPVDQEEPLD